VRNIYKFANNDLYIATAAHINNLDVEYLNGLTRTELSEIKNIDTNVTALDTQVTTNTANIAQNSSDITSIQTELSSLNNVTLANDIEQLEIDTAQNATDLTVLAGLYQTVAQNISGATGFFYNETNDTTTIDNNVQIQKDLFTVGNVSTTNMIFSNSLNNISTNEFSFLSGLTGNVQNILNNILLRITDINYDDADETQTFNALRISGDTFLATVYCAQTQVESIYSETNILFDGMINNISASTFSFLPNVSSDIQIQINNITTNVSNLLTKTTNIAYNNGETDIYGRLNTGDLNGLTQSELNCLDGCVDNIQQKITNLPQMQVVVYHLTGSSGDVDVLLSHNMGTDQMHVTPSFYWHGIQSGGTYNLGDHTSALGISQIIVYDINNISFRFFLRKTTGDNVNLLVTFLCVSDCPGVAYQKNQSGGGGIGS
jgi:hypothetical protein